MNASLVASIVVLGLAIVGIARLHARLLLSRAKHPSLRGHSRWSRRIARLVPYFEYTGEDFFRSDLAPPAVAERRKQALERLRARLASASPATLSYSESLEAES